MLKTYKYNLPGITCINCVMPVESALEACRSINIDSYSTDLVSKVITIIVDEAAHSEQATSQILHDTIDNVGVSCVEIPVIDMQTTNTSNEEPSPSQAAPIIINGRKKLIRSHLIKGILGTALGVGIIALTLSGVTLPLMAMYALIGGSSLLTLILGAESYYDAAKKLIKSRTLTMDALFTVSTLTVVGVSIASIFVPGLPMMLEGGLLIFGFRYLGKALEESINHKVSSGLSFKDRGAVNVKKLAQQVDAVIWEDCQTDSLSIGDIIRVSRGEVIPVDGACESDDVTIYKTIITGAILPTAIKKSENILAGMKVPDDIEFIDIKVTRTASNSYLARLDEKISQSNAERAPIETTANKILQYFVPGVLILAAIAGVAIGIALNPALAIQCATSLLVSACPCTLGFITPLAVKIGMTKAQENGVQFKSSKALQSADRIDTVVFDLNGTLTTGIPEVVDHQFYAIQGSSYQEFLHYLSVLERDSVHPIGKAIFSYANSKVPDTFAGTVSEVDKSNHNGIKAIIDGQSCLIGNIDFLKKHKIDVSTMDDGKHNEAQVVYVVKNNTIIGHVKLKDPLRDDAKLTVKELKRIGKNVCICTGADEETARIYAKELGIPNEHVYANTLGSSDDHDARTKTRLIEHLQKQNKRVAMVGDAGNDALAISKSHFGIAIKSNSGDVSTQEQASAVVDSASLMPVVTAFAVSRQTVRSIKQNLFMTLAYNATVVSLAGGALIAFGFAINPALGVGLMVLQASFILLNQYRIQRQQLPHLNRFKKEMKLTQQSGDSTYKSLQQNGLRFLKKSAKTIRSENAQPSSQPFYTERKPQIKVNNDQAQSSAPLRSRL